MLVVAALIGFGGWYVWHNKNTGSVKSFQECFEKKYGGKNPDGTVTVPDIYVPKCEYNGKTFSNPEPLIPPGVQEKKARHVDLKKFISSTQREIKSKYPNENFCPTIDLAITLPYSVSEYRFKIALNSPNYYLFLCDAKSAADLVKINLQKIGMVVVDKPPVPDSVSTYYESEDAVCRFGSGNLMPVVSIICAYKTDFAKAAAEAQPFVQAYTKSTGNNENNLVFGVPEIGKTKTVTINTQRLS